MPSMKDPILYSHLSMQSVFIVYSLAVLSTLHYALHYSVVLSFSARLLGDLALTSSNTPLTFPFQFPSCICHDGPVLSGTCQFPAMDDISAISLEDAPSTICHRTYE